MTVHMNIHVDDTQLRAALAVAQDEIPRALRNSLNDTLRDIQKAERAHINEVFYITRKGFINQSVKIPKEGGFATKDVARGEVQIDPAKDVLAKFETGGDYGPYKGGKNLAIPSRDIRTGRGGQVQRGTALKNFLPFAMASSVNATRLAGSAIGHLSGRRTVFARNTSERLVGQKGSFFTKTSTGIPVLARRKAGSTRLQYLYLFRPQKRIKPQLGFERTAFAVVPGAWVRNTEAAVVHALRRFNSQ